MSTNGDERGVSEVIGSMLVFGILILLLASYQTFAVPAANKEIEFKHNQQIHSELQDLRTSMQSLQSSGGPTSKTLHLAPTYPTRFLTLNPSPPTGDLQTVDPGRTVSIENATAVNEDTADYFNGTTQNFATTFLDYQPQYNEYRTAPETHIEGTVIYNEFDNGENIPLSDQQIIQGRNIRLGLLSGELSEQTQTATVDVVPVSTGLTTVQINSTNGNPIKLKIPTNIDEETWHELLGSEIGGKYVKDWTVNGDVLTITLDPAYTYNLQMAKIGIGSGVGSEDAHYLVKESGDGQFIEQNERSSVTVQVRDRFNNPVSGVEVMFNSTEINDLDGTVLSDENGNARATFTTPDENITATITATFGGGTDDREKVEFEVNIGTFSVPPQNVGEDINPGEGIIYKDATFFETGAGCGGGGTHDGVILNLENLDSEERSVAELRFNAYVPQDPGASGDGENAEIMVIDDGPAPDDTFTVGEPYEGFSSTNTTFSGHETKTYDLTFKTDPTPPDNEFEPHDGDYFITSVIFGDGSSSIYIIAPSGCQAGGGGT